MVGSGKWTDASAWKNDYPGTTIKSTDLVIITGQVTANAAITVEGTLQVEKGAAMVGMKDLVIANSGKFVNNGNTVMKRIYNEGSICNNLLMEAMLDFDNKGKIENNNSAVAGNNFDNFGGNAAGKDGAYFVNNNISTSPASSFGKNVRVFYGSQVEGSATGAVSNTPFLLNISMQNNAVVLSVSNTAKCDAPKFVIEKSDDGKYFSTLKTITGQGHEPAVYTDHAIKNMLTYYRVTAVAADGHQTILPIATVKSASTNSMTMVD